MTATAVRIERGFSTPRVFYPEGGKSVAGPLLTQPEDIIERVNDLAGYGPWTTSASAIRARELAFAIAAIAAQHAAATGDYTVGPEDIADLLAASAARGLGTRPELDTLYADGIIGRAGNGRIAVTGPAGHGKPEKSYPGWDGPVTGLRHVPRADQHKRFLHITAHLVADGLPEAVRFPPDVESAFEQDRNRGSEVTLAAWAWAVIFNQSLSPGEHPISRRTAANRLAELRDAEELVMTRVSKTRLDLRTGRWHTTPSSYALPRPGLPAPRLAGSRPAVQGTRPRRDQQARAVRSVAVAGRTVAVARHGGRMRKLKRPELPAYPRDDGVPGFKVWCEFCDRWHYHGLSYGHRAAHCHNRASPYADTGYVLVRPPKGSTL